MRNEQRERFKDLFSHLADDLSVISSVKHCIELTAGNIYYTVGMGKRSIKDDCDTIEACHQAMYETLNELRELLNACK